MQPSSTTLQTSNDDQRANNNITWTTCMLLKTLEWQLKVPNHTNYNERMAYLMLTAIFVKVSHQVARFSFV
jgi:hypothetical protein